MTRKMRFVALISEACRGRGRVAPACRGGEKAKKKARMPAITVAAATHALKHAEVVLPSDRRNERMAVN